MRDKKVNSSLQRRIGAYIEYQYKRQRSRDESLEQGIIMKLAPNLREELIYEAHASLFDSIPWMKYFSAEFIKSLAFSIEEYNYSEKEIIYQVGRLLNLSLKLISLLNLFLDGHRRRGWDKFLRVIFLERRESRVLYPLQWRTPVRYCLWASDSPRQWVWQGSTEKLLAIEDV